MHLEINYLGLECASIVFAEIAVSGKQNTILWYKLLYFDIISWKGHMSQAF